MDASSDRPAPPQWPGFDQAFRRDVADFVSSARGRTFLDRLRSEFNWGGVKPLLLGPPVSVERAHAERIRAFTSTYHAAIERIVRASREDEDLRRVLSLPEALAEELRGGGDEPPGFDQVHLCRLDLYLDAEGGFHVLETNANCPGLLIYAGDACLIWREFLDGSAVSLPRALPSEDPEWIARWYLDVAEEATGVRPSRVPVLRVAGRNRLELGEQVERFALLGVDAFEADPREISLDENGAPVLGGEPFRHAYLKLGIQNFLEIRSDLDPLVESIRAGRLFVQNGLRGRWVGDNKLCLAVLSDPAFAYLFDDRTLEVLEGHIPWSRNLALCDQEIVERVRRDKDSFVLKSPLDTRGQGVVVGREAIDEEWASALSMARARGWLVQERLESTWIESDFDNPSMLMHDLAIGSINGEVSFAFVRSSSELRVNVARSGRMHPVFMDL
jgi:hypothetical protein